MLFEKIFLADRKVFGLVTYYLIDTQDLDHIEMASLSLGEDDKEATNANSSATTSADAPAAAAKKIEISIKDWDPGCWWTAFGVFTPSQSWGDVFTWWCEERKSSTRRGDGLAEYARFMIKDVTSYSAKPHILKRAYSARDAETWRPKLRAYFEKMSDATHTEMLLGDMEFLFTAEYPIHRINLVWNRARSVSLEHSQHKKGKPNHNFFVQ